MVGWDVQSKYLKEARRKPQKNGKLEGWRGTRNSSDSTVALISWCPLAYLRSHRHIRNFILNYSIYDFISPVIYPNTLPPGVSIALLIRWMASSRQTDQMRRMHSIRLSLSKVICCWIVCRSLDVWLMFRWCRFWVVVSGCWIENRKWKRMED